MAAVPPPSKPCPRCGIAVNVHTQTCPHCGNVFAPSASQPPAYVGYSRPVRTGSGMIQMPAGSHQVTLVIVLSVFIGPWIGMILNGQVAKGLLFGLLAGVLIGIFTCGYGLLLWYPIALIDAILVANRLNRGEAVGEWQFF